MHSIWEIRKNAAAEEPVWGRVKFEDLADWVVKCDCPVRMQLQMHKLIWGDRKGV